MAERKKGSLDPWKSSKALFNEVPNETFAERVAKKRREAKGQAEKRGSESEAAACFTLKRSAEQVVSAAARLAEAVQGRSDRAAGSSSQCFTKALQSVIHSFFNESNLDLRVRDLAGMVCSILELTKCLDQCRPVTSTGKFDLFPLPVTRCGELFPQDPKVLQCLSQALNSLSGVEDGPGSRGTMTSVSALKRMAESLEHSAILNEPLPKLDFKTLFSHKKVDYQGEEVLLAKPVVWESIRAALPNEVGQLFLRDFCSEGVLHFIDNFEDYLLPESDRTVGRPPRVICDDNEWEIVAPGLVSRGLCKVVRESELFMVNSTPVVNGMFAVSKQEFRDDGVELCRLIMNLKPLNCNSRNLQGDTGTLPSIVNLSGMYLEQDELILTSSEDIRCFFYLFAVPDNWTRYLGFAKAVPDWMIPPEFNGERGFLVSRVLPMGYVNSVGIAQHIHRNVVLRAMGDLRPRMGGEVELRRDRPFSQSSHLIRVYLDNFDELMKTDKATAEMIKNSPSKLVEQLRGEYLEQGLPRHPKKSVETSPHAEVQGAWLDGEAGTLCAKPAKIAKYVALGVETLRRGNASQRELQVLGGGFVYISMFKRPLLSGLNEIWRDIVALEEFPKGTRLPLCKKVAHEIARFIGLVPLAVMNFRAGFDERVTASDASTSGGGACVTRGLTPYGEAASLSRVRGDIPDVNDFNQILSIGLFDGIGALRVALDLLKVPVAGHISVERSEEARRVVEAHFPDVIVVEDVHLIDETMCKDWALRFSNVTLVIIGSGPPCQGVSGLNADRRGALRDHRSSLFLEVPRVTRLVKGSFPWAQVHNLTENVASMDWEDCEHMNQGLDQEPWFVDAAGISLCNRPRLYWLSWDPHPGAGVEIFEGSDGQLPIKGEIKLQAEVDAKQFLEPGWELEPGRTLPTFTTSRPSDKPGRRPAGLKHLQPHEVDRWQSDKHRYPPYQYRDINTLRSRTGEKRTPSIREREVILGFPSGYTLQCVKKAFHGREVHEDCRKTLLGNSWSVPVVAWLLGCLLHLLGFMDELSPADIVRRITPGKGEDLQSVLLRPPLVVSTATRPCSVQLVRKLAGLVSLKGEDILLQSSTDVPVRYHRLRASVPAGLWRWKTISGWKWSNQDDHINVLELRAVLTTIKWRIERLHQQDLRCVHLVDSLVVLHSLTRGRSSSRKMRRTLMRISGYLLASGLAPLWAYVDTHQNPADRPSRRHVKKRWVKK